MITSLHLTQDSLATFNDPTFYISIIDVLQYVIITHLKLTYSTICDNYSSWVHILSKQKFTNICINSKSITGKLWNTSFTISLVQSIMVFLKVQNPLNLLLYSLMLIGTQILMTWNLQLNNVYILIYYCFLKLTWPTCCLSQHHRSLISKHNCHTLWNQRV